MVHTMCISQELSITNHKSTGARLRVNSQVTRSLTFAYRKSDCRQKYRMGELLQEDLPSSTCILSLLLPGKRIIGFRMSAIHLIYIKGDQTLKNYTAIVNLKGSSSIIIFIFLNETSRYNHITISLTKYDRDNKSSKYSNKHTCYSDMQQQIPVDACKRFMMSSIEKLK